jgi:phage anti-repressor protein
MLTPIKVFTHEVLGSAVSGRELYSLIYQSTSKRDIFSDWFVERIRRLSLVDNKDYVRSSVILPGAYRAIVEYTVSVSAAKKLADFQPAKRGIGVLNYLTQYERNPESLVAQPANGFVNQGLPLLASTFRQTPEIVPKQSEIQLSQPIESVPTVPMTHIEKLLQEVTALAEAEKQRANQPETPATEIIQLQTRMEMAEGRLSQLGQVEARVNLFFSLFQQAYQSLQDLTPIDVEPLTEEPVIPTTRSMLIRLVNSFAAAERRTEHETWKFLYGQFDLRSGFNVYALAPSKGERNYLNIIEKQGQVEALYSLAKKLFVLPELR